ncbi:hypothetical protein GH714_026847 [Hevea brasiliensis]|uniref:BHLH domain-containing protein n=1 Tax=Hevea brasiliensis TaxID=3981 RepID=A0A6A6MDH3_HEVBR|nr:hypothetical protein GH714_026847 [Hevea brasiliensis]
MFPFQQNNEFSSQISSNPHQDIAEDNPILGGTSNLSNFMVDGQPPLILANSNTNNEVNYTCDEKKIIRKEIERQRRQQMSTLHGSLRSLLPLESLKVNNKEPLSLLSIHIDDNLWFSLMGLQGKRSMSDHLNAAAKYIKNLQNNVQELSVKRDMLKNLSDSSTSLGDQGTEISSQNNFMNTIVTVRSHVGGVEIGVSCGSGENSFPLSRVLEAVVEEGFDVVSCISTKRDGRLYSTIQCQASHLTCIDVAELQQKLNDIAVKRLKAMSAKAEMEFAVEMEILGRVRHKNLLGLRGFYAGGDERLQAGGDERLIVYDYMPNHSWITHLHGQLASDCLLDWTRRMNTAIGSAEGLAKYNSLIHILEQFLPTKQILS